MRKTLLRMDNSRIDPTILFMEKKYHFLWNFSLAIFMGIKTVRGPLVFCGWLSMESMPQNPEFKE